MKWQDFRELPYYEDRLPPGADRALPGEYAAETERARPGAKPQFATLPPTPLEAEAYKREKAARILSRSYQRLENQPETLGMARSKGSADPAWLGMIPDYPDRLVQRALTPEEQAVQQMLLEEMAKQRDRSSRQTLKQILGR